MLLNACADDTSNGSTTLALVATPAPATAPTVPADSAVHGHEPDQAQAGAATELTVTARDLAFEPTELSVPVNQPVRLTFINSGAIEHDWEVHEITVTGLTAIEQPVTFNERMTGLWDAALADGLPYAAAGSKEQMVIEFIPTTPGTYEMMCMVPGHAQAGMTGTFTVTAGAGETAATTPTTAEPVDFEEMDRLHEAGIASFPATTAGLGGQPLEFRTEGDVKVFDLTCDVVQWEVEPGKLVEAWGYNGVVPGPEIRVTEGDKVRINVTNNLAESTAIHWHGLMVPNAMDGVPFITQPPIKPGATFVYEFAVKPAGTHMYHSHLNAAHQVSKGLLGAFIVEPKDATTRPAFDQEWTIVINDGPLGFTLNGKSFPATQPFVVKQGEQLLIRYMNEGMMIHPMHLHGMPQLVIAKDGYLQPMPWLCDTLNVAPGERWEVIVDATELGTWALHCHILTHAESEHGMFGMVTALIVEE